MQFKDYYQILGIEPGAGEAEIKSAYRRQARKYHPDVSKEPGAEEQFKAVNEAYEALRDAHKRAAYDQLRTRGFKPGDDMPPPGAGGFGGGGFGGGGADFDFEDIFANAPGGAGGGFSDFFEQMFGRGRSTGAGPRQQPRSGPARARLRVPLTTIYSGGTARVNVQGRTLEVKVPKGIKPGQSIRLGGQGGQGNDLHLQVEYAPDARFEVDGRNILHVLPLDPWQAALGDTVSVPTLGGAVELRIPAGSEAGKRLRLRGRGLPDGANTGDQIVEIEVQAPVPITDAQKKAYTHLRESFGKASR